MIEEWKSLEFIGHPQYYVSNLGRFKGTQGIKKLCYNNQGYLSITIYLGNNKKKSYDAHRLVAQAFISNPNKFPNVLHRNGIKDDICVNNLYWGTQKQNLQDCISVGEFPRGDKSNRAKLTETQAIEILLSRESYTILAHKYNISTSAVGNLKQGKTWGHLQKEVAICKTS